MSTKLRAHQNQANFSSGPFQVTSTTCLLSRKLFLTWAVTILTLKIHLTYNKIEIYYVVNKSSFR